VNAPPARSPFERVVLFLHRLEDGTLALLLGVMVVLAPLQIFLRNFFDTGLIWADPFLRVLVLWVGLLGAVAASRGNRQISIDVFSRFASPRVRAAVAVVTSFFTAGVSLTVAYYAWQFVATEMEYETIAFGGIASWMTEIILPYAFAAIAVRYISFGAVNAAVALGLREPAA